MFLFSLIFKMGKTARSKNNEKIKSQRYLDVAKLVEKVKIFLIEKKLTQKQMLSKMGKTKIRTVNSLNILLNQDRYKLGMTDNLFSHYKTIYNYIKKNSTYIDENYENSLKVSITSILIVLFFILISMYFCTLKKNIFSFL